MSLLDGHGGDEHASLEIEGVAYEVVSLGGEEAISSLFRYEVTVASCPSTPRNSSSPSSNATTTGNGT